MIYKRVAARLKGQDWLAITIELMIVIVGVYIGTWVANRNQQSAERGDTIRLVNELRPEIRYQEENFRRFERYQATTAAYAKVAMAGWRQYDDRRNAIGVNQLPARCSIDLPDNRFTPAASALRARPDLVGELRWHFAAIASYVDNLQLLGDRTRRALNRIGSGS